MEKKCGSRGTKGPQGFRRIAVTYEGARDLSQGKMRESGSCGSISDPKCRAAALQGIAATYTSLDLGLSTHLYSAQRAVQENKTLKDNSVFQFSLKW